MPRAKLPDLTTQDPELQTWTEQHLEPRSEQFSRVIVTFGGVADVEKRIRHRIVGRPTGFRIIDSDRACLVYRDTATTKIDKTHLWLKCDTASAKVTLEIT